MLRFRLILFLAIVILASSCSINKDFLFKTDTDYVFDNPRADTTLNEFILVPNDIITFDVFTNDGSVVIEAITNTATVGTSSSFRSVGRQYLIDGNGDVDLPVIGKIHAAGYTITDFQEILKTEYAKQLVNPYVQVTVVNRRVLVFPGRASVGAIVGLTNPNTRLIEALAVAGGLQDRADASRIKIIRKVNDKHEVYLVDLSKIEGIAQADMIVESGDIIYVESTPDLVREARQDFLPVIQTLTTVIFTIILFRRL